MAISVGTRKPQRVRGWRCSRPPHSAGVGNPTRAEVRPTHVRWYDPTVGRWLTEDPAAADENLYRYCGNGPTDGTDPSGMGDQSLVLTTPGPNGTWNSGSGNYYQNLPQPPEIWTKGSYKKETGNGLTLEVYRDDNGKNPNLDRLTGVYDTTMDRIVTPEADTFRGSRPGSEKISIQVKLADDRDVFIVQIARAITPGGTSVEFKSDPWQIAGGWRVDGAGSRAFKRADDMNIGGWRGL